MSSRASFTEISDNFTFLDDWEDRYRYLIELGETLNALKDCEKTEANKINGCVSQVWLCSNKITTDGNIHLHYRGDSDAMIVKGLVAVLIAYYDGHTADWIVQNDAISMFDQLGLREHLTSQRSNGLVAMVERIRNEAQQLLTSRLFNSSQ